MVRAPPPTRDPPLQEAADGNKDHPPHHRQGTGLRQRPRESGLVPAGSVQRKKLHPEGVTQLVSDGSRWDPDTKFGPLCVDTEDRNSPQKNPEVLPKRYARSLALAVSSPTPAPLPYPRSTSRSRSK